MSSSTPPPSSQQLNNSNPPLLVYNRISTTIGEPQRTSPSQQLPHDEAEKESNSSEKEKSKSAKETAVWYEYGCV